MPQITVPKGKLKGFSALPAGIYDLQLQGFEPEWSKKKDSINLNPKLVVVNNANTELNGQRAFDNLNSQAGWVHIDFCHGFGELMTGEENGVPMENWSASEAGIPGEFQENQAFPGDPTKWVYVGLLLMKICKVEIINKPGFSNPAKVQAAINKYFCTITGCAHEHSQALA